MSASHRGGSTIMYGVLAFSICIYACIVNVGINTLYWETQSSGTSYSVVLLGSISTQQFALKTVQIC